jgi:hypothetical protein
MEPGGAWDLIEVFNKVRPEFRRKKIASSGAGSPEVVASTLRRRRW